VKTETSFCESVSKQSGLHTLRVRLTPRREAHCAFA